MTDSDYGEVVLGEKAGALAATLASETTAKSPGTPKSASVIKLLSRAKGATIADMQGATAWQPHSVRAFLSGLRKKGFAVTKEQRKSGETAYRLLAKSSLAGAVDA